MSMIGRAIALLSRCADHAKDLTIIDPQLLLEEVERIEADGVGVDNEEFMTGMVAFAVPVYKHENGICFTVSVHAPTVRK